MKKIKDYCKNNSSSQATYQWGNTLVPVIISLAISAIATVAFLNQGANLSQKNKILMAQNEIARAIQQWNILKSTKPISIMADGDIPTVTNVFGNNIEFKKIGRSPEFKYYVDSNSSCSKLLPLFSQNMEGVPSSASIPASSGFGSTTVANPRCEQVTKFSGLVWVVVPVLTIVLD